MLTYLPFPVRLNRFLLSYIHDEIYTEEKASMMKNFMYEINDTKVSNRVL